MKRILATLLAVCMVLSMLVIVPFTATAAVTGADESNLGANEELVGYKAVTPTVAKGTYIDLEGVDGLGFQTEYEISTVAGLLNLATLASAGETFEGVTVYLTADVDLIGSDFAGIPNFAGTFDGQSYKVTLDGYRLFTMVTGPAVIKNVEADGIGLGVIGTAKGSATGAVTIHNVLSNFSDPNTGSQKVGGILGDLQAGTVNITNCTNAGPITVNSGNSFSGGIVGYVTANAGGTIENCLNTGKLVGKEYFGGIVGIQYAGTLTIRNCVNEGAIEGSAFTAGIHGCVIGTAHISNCTNKGTVAGKANAVNSKAIGGIAGQIGNGSITNCLNAVGANISNVKGGGSAPGELVAGIAGNVPSAAVSIGNCKNEATVTAVEGQSVGGIIGCCPGINSGVANCTNTGKIQATGGGQIVGGIVGKDYGNVTVYTNCKNTGEIFSGRSGAVADHLGGQYAGGIVGNGATITVENCENTGAVTANGADTNNNSFVGGIVAHVSSGVSIDACVNRGAVTASGSRLGGILGNSVGGVAIVVTNCDNYGRIATNGSNTAGIVGYTQSTADLRTYTAENGDSIKISARIENCNNYGEIVSSGNSAGITACICNGMEIINCDNKGVVNGNSATAIACQVVTGANALLITDCNNYAVINNKILANNKVDGLISYVSTWNEAASKVTNSFNYAAKTQWVGYQVRTNGDSTIDLRLVGSIDNINYNSVGFDISVSYMDGETLVTKTLTKSLTKAYSALLAEGDPITAPAYRGADAKLFALVIEDLPTGVELTFNVTTYSLLTYDAEIVNGESATFTVTLG